MRQCTLTWSDEDTDTDTDTGEWQPVWEAGGTSRLHGATFLLRLLQDVASTGNEKRKTCGCCCKKEQPNAPCSHHKKLHHKRKETERPSQGGRYSSLCLGGWFAVRVWVCLCGCMCVRTLGCRWLINGACRPEAWRHLLDVDCAWNWAAAVDTKERSAIAAHKNTRTHTSIRLLEHSHNSTVNNRNKPKDSHLLQLLAASPSMQHRHQSPAYTHIVETWVTGAQLTQQETQTGRASAVRGSPTLSLSFSLSLSSLHAGVSSTDTDWECVYVGVVVGAVGEWMWDTNGGG